MGTGPAWTNAALTFGLELAALGVLAVGGWRLGGDSALRVVLAVALPLVAAVLWGAFAAPHAAVDSTVGRLAVQAGVFGGAAAVLAAAVGPRWGAGFLALVVANLLLAVVLPPVGTSSA